MAVVTAEIRGDADGQTQNERVIYRHFVKERWILAPYEAIHHSLKSPMRGAAGGKHHPGPASKGPREERREAGGRWSCDL